MVAAHREHARLCGCAEREPARDPSRGRKGAVCAEAGRTRPGTSPRALENGYVLLSVCSNGGDIVRRLAIFIDTNTGALTRL